MKWNQGDAVRLTYEAFDLDELGEPTIPAGPVTEPATITRISANKHYLTVTTESGKVFVRHVNSGKVEAILCSSCSAC